MRVASFSMDWRWLCLFREWRSMSVITVYLWKPDLIFPQPSLSLRSRTCLSVLRLLCLRSRSTFAILPSILLELRFICSWTSSLIIGTVERQFWVIFTCWRGALVLFGLKGVFGDFSFAGCHLTCTRPSQLLQFTGILTLGLGDAAVSLCFQILIFSENLTIEIRHLSSVGD